MLRERIHKFPGRQTGVDFWTQKADPLAAIRGWGPREGEREKRKGEEGLRRKGKQEGIGGGEEREGGEGRGKGEMGRERWGEE